METIHLREKLVERVFALVVARKTGIPATCTTDGIDFVDKDNAGSFLLGLFKEVAHTRCTYAHKHLHEIGTRNGEKRHIRLTCNRLSQQGFTCSRRAYQQCALGNLCSQLAIFCGSTQKIDNLFDLNFRLSQSGYVFEGNLLGRLLVVDLCACFADIHQAIATATRAREHASHQENPDNNQNKRCQIYECIEPTAFGTVNIVHIGLGCEIQCTHILPKAIDRRNGIDQLHTACRYVRKLLGVAELSRRRLRQVDVGFAVVDNTNLCHFAIGNQR